MSFGFGFALPAYPLRGGTGNNPFNQLGPTLDLSFTGVVTDLTDPNGYTLNTDFIIPQYQIAAQYLIWETGVGLVDKTFSQIITFTRASTGTFFDSAGVLQSAANDTPRFDYNPSTLAAQGLLIEEARTNSIRNNTMVGASAGVSPTNWGGWNTTVNGVTIASSAAGTENGIAYIDVAVSGTCTLTGTAQVPSFEAATQIAATVGQTWTESVYWTLVSGSLGDSSFNVRLTETDSGGLSLTSGDSAAVVPAVGNLRAARFTFTRTLTNASTAFLVPRLRFGFVSGSTYNFTLRIGLPQLELGAFATSVIPTTTMALTRSADVASVNTLSPWFNATEGTLFAQFLNAGDTAIQRFASINDGTANNSIEIISSGAGVGPYGFVQSGGSGQTPGPSPSSTITANTLYKTAIAYATDNAAGFVNGTQNMIDTSSVTVPTGLTKLQIGSQTSSAFWSNAWIQRVTYYPRRLSQAEGEALTA